VGAIDSLLNKYRKARGLPSDSALATDLGISRQSVFQWRKGIAWPKDDHIVEMAIAIGEQPEQWLVTIATEKAPTKARKYWMKLPQAAAALVLALGVAPSGHASIASSGHNAHEATPYTLCAIAGAAAPIRVVVTQLTVSPPSISVKLTMSPRSAASLMSLRLGTFPPNIASTRRSGFR
jgi:hypothetical protein